MKFQNVKGTRDFYPPEMAVRNWLVGKWREVSQRHGFEEYDGPALEYLDLYVAKSGEGIVSELYHFEDRGGRALALRPEMTPTLARMVAARANALPKPIKWFCVPNFFRAERPQRGRLREFLQWNIDIIGAPEDRTDLADAECISVALDLFEQLGLTTEHVEMRISSRTVFAEILSTLKIESDRHPLIFNVLDKRGKIPPEVFDAELAKTGLNETQRNTLNEMMSVRGDEAFSQVEAILGPSAKSDSSCAQLKSVLNALKEQDDRKALDYCVFDPSVVRGLDYYTGIVFEAYSTGDVRRAICGGGRYDNLLAEMGGGHLSGVGFGMGDVVLGEVLEECGLIPGLTESVECYVATEIAEKIPDVWTIVNILRRQMKQSCIFSYKAGSLKKQFQQAAQHRAEFCIIVGPSLAVKHMATGRQIDLDLPSNLHTGSAQKMLREELSKTFATLKQSDT